MAGVYCKKDKGWSLLQGRKGMVCIVWKIWNCMYCREDKEWSLL